MRLEKYRTELDDNLYPTLVKEKGFNYPKQLNSPEKIVQMFNDYFHLSRQTEEFVYMICSDTKCKPIGIFEISHGFINGSIANPREIFMKALLCNAASIIIAHNHPSGDTTPSKDDVDVYNRIKQAGEIIGINLLDFIIIGDGYCSFTEQKI